MSNETKEIKSPSLENYKNIKPENPMSTGEADDFWKSEFQNVADASKNDATDINQAKQYFDDNGTLYREGNHFLPNTQYEVNGHKYETDDNGKLFREENHILPNTQFEVNGYSYETDDKGRVISAGGKLRLRDSDYEKKMENVKAIEGQDYKDSDDRGHLIGYQFGGSNRLENLVPMDAKLNQGDFVKLEKTLADAVKDKADVRLKVEPVYEKDSTRPSEFKVSYSIDGDRETTVFRNERVE